MMQMEVYKFFSSASLVIVVVPLLGWSDWLIIAGILLPLCRVTQRVQLKAGKRLLERALLGFIPVQILRYSCSRTWIYIHIYIYIKLQVLVFEKMVCIFLIWFVTGLGPALSYSCIFLDNMTDCSSGFFLPRRRLSKFSGNYFLILFSIKDD